MIIPLGIYITPKRLIGLAAVLRCADSAGTIASNNGRAMSVPTPCNISRREMNFLVMIISASLTRCLRVCFPYRTECSGRFPMPATTYESHCPRFLGRSYELRADRNIHPQGRGCMAEISRPRCARNPLYAWSVDD